MAMKLLHRAYNLGVGFSEALYKRLLCCFLVGNCRAEWGSPLGDAAPAAPAPRPSAAGVASRSGDALTTQTPFLPSLDCSGKSSPLTHPPWQDMTRPRLLRVQAPQRLPHPLRSCFRHGLALYSAQAQFLGSQALGVF